jgi:hypothetical protein
MKSPRRRLPKLSVTLAFALALFTLLGCFLLNNLNTFDIVWIIGTGLPALIITYLIIAPKLLPIANTSADYRGAYRVFLHHLFSNHTRLTLVREGKVVTSTQTAVAHRHRPGEEAEERPRGVIVTDSTTVLALRTDTGISRIVGPGTERDQSPSGVIFTLPGEEIDTIVDLRPQLRLIFPNEPVQMTTRDGIPINARMLAFFTLKGTKARRTCDLAREPMRWPPPFTWRKASVLQAIGAKRILRKGDKDEKTHWSDQVLTVAIPQLRQLIAQHTVDYLTAPLLLDRHPRFAIRDELVKLVRQQLDTNDDFHRDAGIDIRFMAVPIMFPPKPILQQRINSWKTEWHKREAEIQGQAEAEAIRTREQARAQVQGEMTARINDALKEAEASGTNRTDLITLRFLEAMEKMAKDPTTRALLTLDSLKILKQLREMLAPEPASSRPA